MIYLELFWSFFQIGLFSFGGGYAAMPLIQEQVVYKNGWLSMSTFADVISISQMTPGPIAINTATFIGTHVAGFSGAVIATLGCIAPACVIVTLLAYLYYKYREMPIIKNILSGLRPAVVALIASSGVSIFFYAVWGEGAEHISLMDTNFISVILFVTYAVVLRKFKLSPVLIISGAGIIGLIFS